MARNERSTPEPVARPKPCTGCGTYVGICPRDASDTALDARRGCYVPELGTNRRIRCGLCSDMLGELSDLTCGDARIAALMQTDKIGSSFAVARTPEAEELLEAAASTKVIELSELGLEELLASQHHALFKDRKLPARMRLFRWSRGRVPTHRQKLLIPTRDDYLNMLKFYAVWFILGGNHRLLQGLFHFVCRLKGKPVPKPAPPGGTRG